MAGHVLSVTLAVAMQIGGPAPSETPNYPALPNAFSRHGFEGQFEQRYPFDTQTNWVHGYFQEIPAYGGHGFYRPYNYKDVLSQSQTAAGWGLAPQMPYSQQFWHRYQDRATMLKLSQQQNQSGTGMAAYPHPVVNPVVPVAGHDAGQSAAQAAAVVPAYGTSGMAVYHHMPAYSGGAYAAPVHSAPVHSAPGARHAHPGAQQGSSPGGSSQMTPFYPNPSYAMPAAQPQFEMPAYPSSVPVQNFGGQGYGNSNSGPVLSGPALSFPQ